MMMSSESNSSFIFPEDGLGSTCTPTGVSPSLYSTSAPNSSTSVMNYSHHPSVGNSSQGSKCVKVECIYTEVVRLRELLLEKDKEIARLQRETHKLKSVIEKSELTRLPSVSSYQQGGSSHPTKKCGVSGESWPEDQAGLDSSKMRQPERRYKDFRTRQLIRAALSDNDFLKNLDGEQVRDIVDFMHPQSFMPGAYVIQEGEAGAHLYVSAEGQLEVLQDTRHLGTLGPGKAFGELALLYNCKRTATVRAITECKVWTLERRAFQVAMVKAGMRRMEDRLAFLRSVPLLHGLQPLLLARIADCLEVEYYPPGAYIIREGTAGHTFFILSQGRVRVTAFVQPPTADGPPPNILLDQGGAPTNMCVLRELSRGDYFGEQALLKEERRSANVIALPPGVECLTLDRESFMQLIGDLSEFQQHKKSPYSSIKKSPIHSLSEKENQNQNQNDNENSSPAFSRPKYLKPNESRFSERKHASENEDNENGSETALSLKLRELEGTGHENLSLVVTNVEAGTGTGIGSGADNGEAVSTINSESVKQKQSISTSSSPYSNFESFAAYSKGKDDDFEFDRLRLDDLEVVATLGVGGFGRVELVQVSYDPNRVFALKCLPKAHILATQQQEHVYSERNIMISCKSPFIASLYCTFKDSKCIYLLMEACMGGEVWTILRDKGSFDEDTARFVAGCVVLALEFLHERDIVYRDLKPENLMLANDGYVKLVDFGFSKVVPSGQRTWTFCGTPEYVAPEVILNRGHDRTVDYWACGVLLFELLSGLPPWGPMSVEATPSDSSDPLTTYNQILKGIETINFPKNIGRSATSLIRRLCRQIPGERLGAQRGIRDIIAHRWFQGFDWDGLKSHKMKPPIRPRLRGPRDTSNFDKFELDIEDTPDDLSGWDDW